MKRITWSLICSFFFTTFLGISQYGYANGNAELMSAGHSDFVFSTFPLATLYEDKGNAFYPIRDYVSVGFDAPGNLTITGSIAAPRDVVIILGPGYGFGSTQLIVSGRLNLKARIKPRETYDERLRKNRVEAVYEGFIGNTPVIISMFRYANEAYTDPNLRRMRYVDSLLFVIVQFKESPQYAYGFEIPE